MTLRLVPGALDPIDPSPAGFGLKIVVLHPRPVVVFESQRLVVAAVAVHAWVFGGGVEGDGSLVAFLFFGVFMLPPLLVNAWLAWRARRWWSQRLILLTTLLYVAWCAYIYIEVVYWHPDPQGPIAFLFVGIYSLPVMVPAWWAVTWLDLGEQDPGLKARLLYTLGLSRLRKPREK